MSGLLESVCDHIMAKWHRCLPAAGYAIIVESALWRGELPDGLMHTTRSRQSREFYPPNRALVRRMTTMPTDSSTPEPPDDYNPYFYVSYAHSPDAPESQSSDRWVSTFFGDLEGEVKRSASSRSSAISGFFDQRIPPDSDWKEILGLALGRAQVFVPLYSAGYFHRSWPGREWACYRRRLELGANGTRSHVSYLFCGRHCSPPRILPISGRPWRSAATCLSTRRTASWR